MSLFCYIRIVHSKQSGGQKKTFDINHAAASDKPLSILHVMLIDLPLNFSIFVRLYSMSQARTIESRICYILCLISSNSCCLRFTFPCFSKRDRFVVKLACGFLHTKIYALLHKPKDE